MQRCYYYQQILFYLIATTTSIIQLIHFKIYLCIFIFENYLKKSLNTYQILNKKNSTMPILKYFHYLIKYIFFYTMQSFHTIFFSSFSYDYFIQNICLRKIIIYFCSKYQSKLLNYFINSYLEIIITLKCNINFNIIIVIIKF